MNEPTLNSMVLRLDRLERESRHWKMLGVSVVILSIFLLIGATQKEKVIVADKFIGKKFVVVDDDGIERIKMGVSFGILGGEEIKTVPYLIFLSSDFRILASIETYHRGGVFELRDGSGGGIIINIHAATRGPVMRLSDGKGRRAEFLFANNGPFLRLTGKQTKMEVNNSASSLNLYDKDGNKRAVLGSTSLETTRTGTVTKTAESSLVLFDKKGKVIWKAP